MLRRLFFLFPDENHAQCAVDQLVDLDISKRRIHAMSLGKKLKNLPEVTQLHKYDTAFRAQSILWNANLLLFAFAAIVFLITLVIGELFWILSALAMMLVTFFVGQQFVVRVPDVHLSEFTDALAHGEILLMVDVPASRVVEIKGFVHRRHPEAEVGGVGWSMDAFGV